jgi:hypothetical protein
MLIVYKNLNNMKPRIQMILKESIIAMLSWIRRSIYLRMSKAYSQVTYTLCLNKIIFYFVVKIVPRNKKIIFGFFCLNQLPSFFPKKCLNEMGWFHWNKS